MASPLGRLFGKSPIAPVQAHMQHAQECVQLLCELLAATAEHDARRRSDILALIARGAGEALALRHDIREHLPRGLLLAMPRADLLQLVDIQQDIVNRVQCAARLPGLRGLALPGSLAGEIDALCTTLADAAHNALAAIRELDEMVELAFMHRERGPVDAALEALTERVTRCNEVQQSLVLAIAAHESALPAVDAVLLYQLADALGQLALRCGDAGEQLALLLAR